MEISEMTFPAFLSLQSFWFELNGRNQFIFGANTKLSCLHNLDIIYMIEKK